MSMARWFILPLLITRLYLAVEIVLANQIFATLTGSALSRSSREPKYRIEFHAGNSPYVSDEDRETVIMCDAKGQKFLCFLPKIEKVKTDGPVTQQNGSSMIMETEKRVHTKTPDELLDVLHNRCLLREEGWWTYEFCYHKKLRQFHLEGDKVVQEFILGVYDANATAALSKDLSEITGDTRPKDESQRYHTHLYLNGTACDLTNQSRETEVRFVCSESRAIISSITELSTCKYALTIQCPTLCKHPLFQEERSVWETINCNLVPKEGEDDENQQIALIPDDGTYPFNSHGPPT